MTELEKYELVNKAETVKELHDAIIGISQGGYIEGRQKTFNAQQQANNVHHVVVNGSEPNALTRSYGIRQQALYLRYYEKY